jgi:hypothetical protein
MNPLSTFTLPHRQRPRSGALNLCVSSVKRRRKMKARLDLLLWACAFILERCGTEL